MAPVHHLVGARRPVHLGAHPPGRRLDPVRPPSPHSLLASPRSSSLADGCFPQGSRRAPRLHPSRRRLALGVGHEQGELLPRRPRRRQGRRVAQPGERLLRRDAHGRRRAARHPRRRAVRRAGAGRLQGRGWARSPSFSLDPRPARTHALSLARSRHPHRCRHRRHAVRVGPQEYLVRPRPSPFSLSAFRSHSSLAAAQVHGAAAQARRAAARHARLDRARHGQHGLVCVAPPPARAGPCAPSRSWARASS